MCIKIPSNEPHFSLLNDAKPKPCSQPPRSRELLNANDASSFSKPERKPRTEPESMPSMKFSNTSKFGKAMRAYTSYFSEKSMKKSLKEATSQEDIPPTPSSLHTLQSNSGLSLPLIKLLQALPLPYKPSHLETTASIHSDLGNSIHNASSVARRSVELYGVRVWKGLCVVHWLLREIARDEKGNGEVEGIEADAKEELLWWFDVLGHDLSLEGGERGYGPLIKFYITYLKALIASQSPTLTPNLKSTSAQTLLQTHLTLSLSSHTLRSALLLSLTSSPASSSTSSAKLTALSLVILDALTFPTTQMRLVELMRKEGVCEAVVKERECVFERRREEVMGFVGRCRGLELDLGLDLGLDLDVGVDLGLEGELGLGEEREGKGNEDAVEDLGRRVRGLRV
ncbi:hypothetical protein BKA64DRAFT_227263 [Cadophora sp. MPI-SDFR-AT-0126]|nr:hypothetical protein BKA64DRAFT_227263 [Leotiomycetes sp. MPI-SDFR-AT-0126]